MVVEGWISFLGVAGAADFLFNLPIRFGLVRLVGMGPSCSVAGLATYCLQGGRKGQK